MWTPKAPYAATTGTKDFDLKSDNTDPNGSPASPRWAPQPQKLPPTKGSGCDVKPYQATCTDQANYLKQDTGTGLNGLLCTLFGDSSALNGHVDWTVARTSGPVGWLNFADDFDYNLLLLPEQQSGLTGDNNQEPGNGPRYMEVEFDSREFNFGTAWWREFASRAQKGATSGDYTDIQDWLHEGQDTLPYGIAYGVFGIDCEHGCRSEIHPAYVVAIQVNDAKDSNKWAIFARNWGDEGFCSHLNHQLDLSADGNAVRVVLPYTSTAGGPKINKDDYDVATGGQSANQCPTFNFLQDQGEQVTIPLPPPNQDGLTEVFVDFQWPDGASGVKYNQIKKKEITNMLAPRTSEPAQPPNESVEEHLGRLRKEFSGQRVTQVGFNESILKPYLASLPESKRSAATPKKAVAAGCPVPEATNPLPPPPPPGPRSAQAKPHLAKLPTHTNKELWDRLALKDFCDAYVKSGRKLPAGEPPEEKAKLDKVCSDKRLKP